MYLKNAEKSSIDKIRKYLINTNISDKYLLEDQFVSYLKKYNSKNNFEDNSFIYEENGKKIYCPNTIEKKDNKKYLNYLDFNENINSLTEVTRFQESQRLA